MVLTFRNVFFVCHPQANPASSGTPLTKRGYLSKGPFPSDGGISVSMKTYRKRYTVLTGDPNAGGYFLNIYKVRGRKWRVMVGANGVLYLTG